MCRHYSRDSLSRHSNVANMLPLQPITRSSINLIFRGSLPRLLPTVPKTKALQLLFPHRVAQEYQLPPSYAYHDLSLGICPLKHSLNQKVVCLRYLLRSHFMLFNAPSHHFEYVPCFTAIKKLQKYICLYKSLPQSDRYVCICHQFPNSTK